MTRVLCILILVLFAAATAHADSWDGQFGLLGFPNDPTDGTIYDLVVIGGDLYAVGDFTTIGGVSAQCIARWDGNAWHDLGGVVFAHSGLGGYAKVETLIGTPDSLVVVGLFNTVNGSPARLAVWDGASWTGHDSSLLQESKSLASDGTNIYIAEYSNTGIVRWDGATFTQIGAIGGVSNLGVFDLIWYNGGLAASGHFYNVNGVSVTLAAFWDGTTWSDLNPGVWAGELFEHNGLLYACGSDNNINIRYMENGQWYDAVSDNAYCVYVGSPTDAMFFNGNLYRTMVCGTTVPGGVAVNGVCKWTGSAWNNMDGGVRPPDYQAWATGPLEEYQGKLVVGGEFTAAGGMPTPNHLAMWDGDRWYANAPDGRVRALAVSGSDVYLAGDFMQCFETPANRIARWDHNTWHTLGTGINGIVHAMLPLGSDLYVAGEFTNAGGSGAAYLARWDGNAWHPVGSSLGGPVYALATDGTDLYAGGNFLSFQSEVLQRIARWDGSAWHAVGGGITNAGSVRALTINGGNIYAGGDFAYASGMLTGNAAYFDGTNWQTLGYGLDGGMIRALAFHNGDLYAGGDFTTWGPEPMNHIARWDGAVWNKVGNPLTPGVDGPVRTLVSTGGRLFAAGAFANASGAPATNIVSWDGNAWATLGSGLDRPADALAAGTGELLVGGEFAVAGGNGSRRFARYMLTPTAITTAPFAAAPMLEPPVPNPFNPSTQIRYHVPENGHVTIGIYDVTGARVRLLVDEFMTGSSATHTTEWNGVSDDGRRVASGVFFVRMESAGTTQTRKIVLLK
jgi:hypothetical protein